MVDLQRTLSLLPTPTATNWRPQELKCLWQTLKAKQLLDPQEVNLAGCASCSVLPRRGPDLLLHTRRTPPGLDFVVVQNVAVAPAERNG